MSGHTPGPWQHCRITFETGDGSEKDRMKRYVSDTIDRGGNLFFAVLCTKADADYDVCWTGNGHDSAANARLIAAAPDLLAACHAALARLDAPLGKQLEGWQVEQIRAAIARARGEP